MIDPILPALTDGPCPGDHVETGVREPLDPVEDGQAECHKCGEWYRVTAPYGGHACAKDDAYRRGALAMREECAGWLDGAGQPGLADEIRYIAVPEDRGDE